jgi:hypothetical protein
VEMAKPAPDGTSGTHRHECLCHGLKVRGDNGTQAKSGLCHS